MRKKIAFITGASRGIGRAIATRFAMDGYDLALTCHTNSDQLKTLQEKLSSAYKTNCLLFAGDISDYNTCKRFLDETITYYGQLDVLVNNAGISYIGLLTDMTPIEWQTIINTNLTSVFNTCHAALPTMVHQKKGSIINISSVWGCVGASCEVAYSASKGGINAFTQALAKELAPSNITVNAIACGAIDTDMNACLSLEDKLSLADEIPAGRMGEAREVAELAFSITNQSSYLTGQIIRLDGGWI